MYGNILVPIAFDHERCGECALQLAKSLKAPDGKITAIHVMEEIPGYVAAYLPEGTSRQAQHEVTAELDKMAGEAGGGIETKILHGHAHRTILDYATENDVDCIVIASHKPGLEDYFLGSTASRVVRHAGCSVHVIR